ncbi:MAG: isoprenyl transferase [Oscillospiraceae bacterium]|nr:isoprenyl transferase [Oscillospiraceae bacterium]
MISDKKMTYLKENTDIVEVDYNNLPKHIAIVMDGNRRWAKNKGLAAKDGHKAGAENLEDLAKFCNDIGVKHLTVYAFSTENWSRTKNEVSALMLFLKAYLASFMKKGITENIRVNVIGKRDNLEKSLVKSIDEVVEKTKHCTGLTFNIAFNYGGRLEITNAVKRIAEKVKANEISIDEITEEIISSNMYTEEQPDPELFIRTSGELRTSGFLPWQLVYTELYFSEKYWPEFGKEELLLAIQEYQNRNRRFGE